MSFSFKIGPAVNDDMKEIIAIALQETGAVLNGATELGADGAYIAPNPGIKLHDQLFTLTDTWFHYTEQTFDHIRKTVQDVTGILFITSPQMLSPGMPIVSGFSITQQATYDATIGKQLAQPSQDTEATLSPRGSYGSQ